MSCRLGCAIRSTDSSKSLGTPALFRMNNQKTNDPTSDLPKLGTFRWRCHAIDSNVRVMKARKSPGKLSSGIVSRLKKESHAPVRPPASFHGAVVKRAENSRRWSFLCVICPERRGITEKKK